MSTTERHRSGFDVAVHPFVDDGSEDHVMPFPTDAGRRASALEAVTAHCRTRSNAGMRRGPSRRGSRCT